MYTPRRVGKEKVFHSITIENESIIFIKQICIAYLPTIYMHPYYTFNLCVNI